MKLYVRMGDLGDYEEVGGVVELIDHLRAYGIREVWAHGPFGLAAEGYRGDNYISAYFGRDVETPLRGLTADEIAYLNEKLL